MVTDNDDPTLTADNSPGAGTTGDVFTFDITPGDNIAVASLNVSSARFTQMGYGEGQPVADNATAEGKALNRRVELAIMANDKLKKVAEDETS